MATAGLQQPTGSTPRLSEYTSYRLSGTYECPRCLWWMSIEFSGNYQSVHEAQPMFERLCAEHLRTHSATALSRAIQVLYQGLSDSPTENAPSSTPTRPASSSASKAAMRRSGRSS